MSNESHIDDNSNPCGQAAEHIRLKLSRSDSGVTNTQLENWSPTFADLCHLMSSRPEVGEKDGSYFVRGPLIAGASTRKDEHIDYATIVVLDCDSSFDPASGEIVEGAPSPEEVHQVLVSMDISHSIHTTHSHMREGKGNRYRAVIPAVANDGAELKEILEWLCHSLTEKGVYLVNVKENATWSQPWYFPRLAAENATFVCLTHESGQPIDVAKALSWAEAQNVGKTELKVIQSCVEVKSKPSNNSIDRFNEKYGMPEWMLSFLVQHGYSLKGTSVMNNELAYRLLSPQSSTGTPGIVLFHGDDGNWRVFSHHGDKEPLSRAGEPGTASDAFDLFRILEHKGDVHNALQAYERSSENKPVIRLQPGNLPTIVTESIDALSAFTPPQVFKRGQELVRVAHMEGEGETEGCIIPSGTAHLIPVTRSMLTIALSKAAHYERWKKDKWVPADPSGPVISGVLEGFGMWEGIHSLTGICEAPILREDGSLHSNAGYDPATMLYVEGRTPPIDLPEKVSLPEAQEAALRLLNPFEEFPFVEPDQDHAVLLALLLTLILRPQLSTAPLFCVSATTPGTGKGLLVEACNLIARGRDAATMPPIQGRGGEDETRKRITALLTQGISAINLDNWTASIGGESMNALLTTTEWTDRVLGRSSTITLPVRCSLMATGNNLSVRGDMVRRSVAILMDAKVEHPEQRIFKRKDLSRYVLEHRAALLRDLFIILKGYQQAGFPQKEQNPLGRFETWSDMVCGPVKWLGYNDPVESQDRLRELDPEADKLAALMDAWWHYLGTDWKTAADITSALNDENPKDKTGHHALKAALEEAVGDNRDKVNRRTLGWYLRHKAGRMIENYRLERRPRNTKSKHSQQYRVIDMTMVNQ